MTVKRATLLLLIAHLLRMAMTLQWELCRLLRLEWPPLGRLGARGGPQVISVLLGLSWVAYFAIIYRERSQRQNPISLWAITLWTAVLSAAIAVSSAAHFLFSMTAQREAVATGGAALPLSALWWQGVSFATAALWIGLVVLLAHDAKGQQTRRVAAILVVFELLATGLGVCNLVQNEPRVWELVFARSWRVYPVPALFFLVLGPGTSVFFNVCSVLFPYAVWKEAEPHDRAVPALV